MEARAAVLADHQRLSLLALGLVLLAYTLGFVDSLHSMAAIWLRSDTYAHGLLILPISLWLIWRRRRYLRSIPLGPCYPALVPLAGASLLWLLGRAADMLVVEQMGAVLMLLALILLMLGWPLFRALLFPLLYLIFAVPFGEELTPALQQITASITVHTLRLTGIPVYLNGLFIEIPTGRFEVAQACSGIRYLIASFALGTLYAYLTYHRLRSRAIFMVASLLVPVLANGLRAYLIVLIAHLSEMKYATGIDHLIYGWLFFGLVMLLMFWVGSWWRDPDPVHRPLSADPARESAPPAQLALATALAMAVITATLAGGQRLRVPAPPGALPPLRLDLAPWTAVGEPAMPWAPEFIGADRSYLALYRDRDAGPVGLYIADYRTESQGKELINHLNRFFDKETWTLADNHGRRLNLGDRSLEVTELELRALDGRKRRVWYWYRAYGRQATGALEVKLLQALNRLTGAGYLGSAIALAVDYEEPPEADRQLRRFLDHSWAALDAADR